MKFKDIRSAGHHETMVTIDSRSSDHHEMVVSETGEVTQWTKYLLHSERTRV